MLGICVGMQLLFGASEEGGSGLGLLAGPVRRDPGEEGAAHGLERRSRVHAAVDPRSTASTGKTSTSPTASPSSPTNDDVVVAVADHDGRIVAAVEHGAVAGVQFHPERSARAGARLLENALAWSRSA